MSLEDRQDHGTRTGMDWMQGVGLWMGLTEPNGGELTISVEYIKDKFVGVKCGSTRARELAASILELADIVEKWEQTHG